jgi:ABC-2 type transport system permease protein
MNAVPRLLRAELLKISTARSTWALLAALALVTLSIVVLSLGRLEAGELAGAQGVRRVLTIGGGIGYLFTLALGVMGMAGEYRHGSLGQAWLAAPSRWPVVLVKGLAYGLAGLGFGLVALLITFGAGVPGLASEGAGISYSSAPVRSAVLGTLAATALFAVIGVGLGALLRDQVLALSIALGWALLIDSVAMGLEPAVGRFFPGGTVTSLLRSETQDVLLRGRRRCCCSPTPSPSQLRERSRFAAGT